MQVAYYTFSDAVDQQIQHTEKPPKSYPPKNPNFRFCDLKPVELARQMYAAGGSGGGWLMIDVGGFGMGATLEWVVGC